MPGVQDNEQRRENSVRRGVTDQGYSKKRQQRGQAWGKQVLSRGWVRMAAIIFVVSAILAAILAFLLR